MQLFLATAALGIGFGAVLLYKYKNSNQTDSDWPQFITVDGNEQHETYIEVIGLYSRRLIPSETRYLTTDVEFLAFNDALIYFKHLIKKYRGKLTVLTDYHNLTSWAKFEIVKYCHHKWMKNIEQLNLLILYIHGYQNFIADWLLRNTGVNTKERSQLEILKTSLKEILNIN
jgi:RNase H-like domain found in reverse transcriptase